MHDGGYVAMQVHEALQDLPGPALEDGIIDVAHLLAVPSGRISRKLLGVRSNCGQSCTYEIARCCLLAKQLSVACN